MDTRHSTPVDEAVLEQNKAIVTRLCDAANSHDIDLIASVIDQVVDPEVHNTTPLPVAGTGAEALKQVWAMLLTALPDIHVTIEELVAEGDRVVARNTVRGTHRGVYLGRAGTGTRLTYGEMFSFRVDQGRVVEIAGVVDVAGQLRQLGLWPPARS
ncbi:MAG TPA: ester cyclase [Nocardioides sp.]|uniref:ester cyclase n=1 Tax=Nocardioides sp. TaxID=35761 RepID=UPI002E3331CF|nr:ester cyclase [Nocardioides sp.]HEX5086518.1 ester cyclase [Nocardioides sp.]